MNVRLHSHALDRLAERGASEDEVVTTVTQGERFPAKFDRVGFRRNFSFSDSLNVDIAPDGTVYGLELLNANEQLRADDGALVVVNGASGERREISL